ncbi:MAG: TRIC cation channel family protein [Victivallaceae bacterium]
MSYKTLLIADAVGVSMFNIQALEMTLNLKYPGEIAVLMGIITGVAGGIVRDVLTQEKPLLLKRELYAIPLLLGGVVYIFLKSLGVWPAAVFWSGIFSAFLLRLAAIQYKLYFPEVFIYKK